MPFSTMPANVSEWVYLNKRMLPLMAGNTAKSNPFKL